ncbi:hypothetical protein, partial [Nocardia cyriacigeorgica]|uniref:hypothetical protein n=1 Tax=Nocardia cyriacigeorgica TaxID=135487 RepID=UPI002453B1F4
MPKDSYFGSRPDHSDNEAGGGGGGGGARGAHTMAGDLDDALAALTVAWRTTPHIVMADQLGRQQVADLLDRKRTF